MIALAALLAGVVAVFFAGVMLLHRSLYVSAVSLLVVLLQTAVLFVLCGSPLLGLLQVMIYAGAVMVLVVVTVMAAGSEGPRFSDFAFPRPLAWALLIAAAAETALVLGRATAPAAVAVDPALQARLGAVLFKPYALATEAVTLLMFLAALAIAPEKEGA
jgi:NADH-quinone oxidoreductase subunit J